MGVDRIHILPVKCPRTSDSVTRRVATDAEFNAPHIIKVNCPHHTGVATCNLVSLDDDHGNACLFWRSESLTKSDRRELK
jgi:hypothetical protein